MPVTPADLAVWKQRRERFVMLAAYDVLTARVLAEAGIALLLVGARSENVLGYNSTIPVTMEETLPSRRRWAVGPLPTGRGRHAFRVLPGLARQPWQRGRLVKEGGQRRQAGGRAPLAGRCGRSPGPASR